MQRQLDGDLSRTRDPYWEFLPEDDDPEEDPEEDSEDDPRDADPEEDLRDADPEEDPADADPMGEDPVDPTPDTDPVEEEVVWTDIPMHPHPIREDSPPSDFHWDTEEDTEGPAQEDTETEIAPESEPAHPPIPLVRAVDHDYIVTRMTIDLSAAEARVAELRFQLAEERRARLYSDGRDFRARQLRRTVLAIERRALARLRGLPRSHQSRRIRRSDAGEVLSRAMGRVRDAVRSFAD